jgi:hypothetical protein
MRERLLHSRALIVFVLLSLAANLSAATAAHWTVVSQPPRLVNGSPVLFRVTTPTPVRALSGNWLGHEIAFSFDARGKVWFALAGVSLETKPGLPLSNPPDKRSHSKRKFAWNASAIPACC